MRLCTVLLLVGLIVLGELLEVSDAARGGRFRVRPRFRTRSRGRSGSYSGGYGRYKSDGEVRRVSLFFSVSFLIAIFPQYMFE